MKLIYSQGFSKTEKLEWKPVVFNNIVQSFRLIFDAMNELDIKFEIEDNEASIHTSALTQWVEPPCFTARRSPLSLRDLVWNTERDPANRTPRKTWPRSWWTTR